MSGPTAELEVERIMNFIRGFGWEKIEKRMDGEYVVVVVRKKVAEQPPVGMAA